MDEERSVGADSALGATPYFNGALLHTPVLVAAAPTGAQGGVRPRVLYDLEAVNADTALAYLQIFNAASAGAVTVGATAPTLAIGVENGQTVQMVFGDLGVRFDAGIVIAATTTPTGSTSPGVGLVVNLGYA